MPRGCVNRFRLWPLRRDYHSGVLIGAVRRQRSDWSVRVLANDVSTRIDREPARKERSIARVYAQVAATTAISEYRKLLAPFFYFFPVK